MGRSPSAQFARWQKLYKTVSEKLSPFGESSKAMPAVVTPPSFVVPNRLPLASAIRPFGFSLRHVPAARLERLLRQAEDGPLRAAVGAVGICGAVQGTGAVHNHAAYRTIPVFAARFLTEAV